MTCQGDNRRTETFTTVLLTYKYRRKGQKMNSDALFEVRIFKLRLTSLILKSHTQSHRWSKKF